MSPRLPARWHPLPHAVLGATLAATTPDPLGLRPPQLWAGLRWGGAASVPVVFTIAASTANRTVRAGMAERALPTAQAEWLLLGIPFGTVWSEEVAYRAALGGAAARAFGPRVGRILTSLVFGLSHVPDARAAGESVAGAVALTGAAGWVFSWLHAVSGSVAAPMLAHLAINEAGAVAALAVQRRRGASAGRRR